ncbi:NAD(P)H nitroreductase [Pararhodospirillum oryzae]|uniref:Putative NAD(P)H nitroreductase n=1 Tax=Pararhodospirillum oryzae TaxID=478448 RepID=A0A512H6R8_9PROT|nr:NAD(P)H nitroreductase [Pararhodospirillum oryzae]GEO81118.1 NAD(P)H nitroreductase [Pararhodospirillum oryzae]
MDALELLLTRRSCAALAAPAPTGEALDAILTAGTRVPDFKHLHPYEFLIASGAGLDRLGALMTEAARKAGKPDEVIERCARLPHRAPLVIVVVARHKPHEVVTVFEQQLCAGAALHAMQMAAVAQGFGGIWRSGWLMVDRTLHAALDLGDQDQIVGFLYLGTPTTAPAPRPAVPLDAVVRSL